MSQLSNKTEKRALYQLVKCLKHLDSLSKFKVSAIDAFEARQAENHIRAIIESSGFNIRCQSGKGHRLIKSKHH